MGQVVPFPLVSTRYPDRTTSLHTVEPAFLIAVRWWVLGYRNNQDPMPRLSRGLKAAGARDAAFSLNSFMAIVADTAHRPIAIHRPRCHGFSSDEQHLLFAASQAQYGDRALARQALRDVWISEAGATFALEPLGAPGALFAAAGLHFTRRRSPPAPSEAGAIEAWMPATDLPTIH
jgi:hypothetical protein